MRIVRRGEPRQSGEGLRIGTVRRPPRGVPKTEFAVRDFYDTWLPELAPSQALLTVAQQPGDERAWRAVERKYRAELARPEAARLVDLLVALSRQTALSVGCYCEDEARCHRSILRAVLGERGAELLWPGVDAGVGLGGRPTGYAVSMEFALNDGLAVLRRTPGALRALLDGLPVAWTEATEGPDTWSPYVVIGHLIHGERTDWIPRARIILAQGETRRFEPYDRFAQFRESGGKTMTTLLDEFAALRAANLATLEDMRLTEAQLRLEGEHPAFGPVTLRQLLATWVAHDLSHLTQVSRVMARQYREAVGPWRAYLSVMDR